MNDYFIELEKKNILVNNIIKMRQERNNVRIIDSKD